MKLTKTNIDILIKNMDVLGLYFDGIESSADYIRFTYTGGCFPLVFGSWQEVKEYLSGLVIDDPEKAETVYTMLSNMEE